MARSLAVNITLMTAPRLHARLENAMTNSELSTYYQELGITPSHLLDIKLPLQAQAPFLALEVVEVDLEGRPFILTKEAAVAWRKMRDVARAEGMAINPASGFRSYLYQKKLIEKQLASGKVLKDILKATAVPGYSEHHTGRAIDICADVHVLEEEFHLTDTYRWLNKRAGQFKFRLSFPPDNQFGMIFEPWHWFYAG
jgi:zinc D-Ala-D-Ala carboxypeptidase